MLRGSDPHPRGHVADLRIGFAPQRKGIGMLACHLDRGVRRTADEDRNAIGAVRLDLRKPVLDLVIFAVIGERLLARPFGANHVEKLIGTRVTLVLVVEGVAILPEFDRIPAGDDVERNPAFR